MTNALWLLLFRRYLRTNRPLFARLACRLAPRVTWFPDEPATRVVRHLRTCGLTGEQIGAVWDVNGTWENVTIEIIEPPVDFDLEQMRRDHLNAICSALMVPSELLENTV